MYKNRLKVLCLMIILIFLTGCTADYNIIITSNNKVIEDVKISEDKNVLITHFKDLQEAKESFKVSYESFLKKNKYISKYKITDTSLDGLFYRKSNSFDSILSLDFFQTMFGTAEVDNTKEYTSFKTTKFNPYGTFVDEEGLNPLIDKININIQFHNKLLENNADSFNEDTNIYTWTITPEEFEKSIEFKIGKEKRYDIIITYLWKQYWVALVVGFSLLVIIIVSILRLIKMTNDANKI